MYAPDCVRGNDGKYYLYYCLSGWRGKGGYGSPISVAVSAKPDGPFEYLGVVLNPDGTPFMKYGNFDPAVINDDGIIRLYSGTWYPIAELSEEERQVIHADETDAERFCKPLEHIKKLQAEGDSVYGPHHMTLADDMRTITSEPVRVMPLKRFGTPYETDANGKGHGFFEGSSIRKINNTYYFLYYSWPPWPYRPSMYFLVFPVLAMGASMRTAWRMMGPGISFPTCARTVLCNQYRISIRKSTLSKSGDSCCAVCWD